MAFPPRARTALLLGLVACTPLLAGCNLHDWVASEGRVTLNLVALSAENTSLNDFRSLEIAVSGVSIKQYVVLDAKEFKFPQPLVIDLVAKGTKNERVTLVQDLNESVRPIESITLHIDVISAVGADGQAITICHENDPKVASYPCVFVPANQAFRHQDRNIAIPRGGSVTLGFPIAVQKFQPPGQRNPEYALFEDPSLFEIS